MEFTGERYIPGAVPRHLAPRIHLEHVHLYAFAARFVRGRVLDLGCGAGYGAPILAASADRVVGLDVEPHALRYAATRFGEPGRVVHVAADAAELPFGAAEFDAVVCFETIEHVEDGERLAAEAARVLRPGGAFVVSSPVGSEHRLTYPSHSNPFHVHEYETDELTAMLSRHFARVRVFGQRLVAASWIWPHPGRFQGPLDAVRTPADDPLAPTGSPLYAVAVCSSASEPLDLPGPSLLPGRLEQVLDGLVESICERYESQIRESARLASEQEARRLAEADALRARLTSIESSRWWRLGRILRRRGRDDSR